MVPADPGRRSRTDLTAVPWQSEAECVRADVETAERLAGSVLPTEVDPAIEQAERWAVP